MNCDIGGDGLVLLEEQFYLWNNMSSNLSSNGVLCEGHMLLISGGEPQLYFFYKNCNYQPTALKVQVP